MSTTYATPTSFQPSQTLRREPSRWRMRLSRFIRGQRRSKALEPDAVSATAPRLAPIKSSTTSTVTYGNIADDFASLRFDEKGELGQFDFSFDAPSTTALSPKRDVSGGSEREPDTLKVAEVKRESKSAAGERTTKTHGSAPSIDLPRDEAEVDKGFFDAWLLNAVQDGKLAELKDDDNKPSENGTVVKRQSVTTRTPIATQFATVAPPIASQFTAASRPTSMAFSTKADSTIHISTDDKSKSPGQKRKADDDAPTSPSKRGSIIRSNMSAVSSTTKLESEDLVNGLPKRGGSLHQTTDLAHDNTSKRHSANFDETRGRCPPVSIKRYSMGSDYGSDSLNRTSITNKRLSLGATVPADALKVDYRRPSAVPSLIDSESASSASTSPTMATSIASVTPARRFEIKTASLLTPVTNAIADKQTANIGDTISRINHGNIPRSSGEGHLERSSSRSGSRHRTSHGYPGGSRSASPAGISRNTTPEPGPYPEATPRARRPSSRLSDRMSWLKELDETNGKQTGRDFVFRKMEGGVAAKLATFEHKKASAANGAQTPNGTVFGRSRANSNASRQCSSELYSIEGNKLTRRATSEAPGSISNVVNDDFKQKLESMTGHMAEKLSKVPAHKQIGSNSARGPVGMAEARRKIPQDVLDFIALSGVDPEVAINEYMEQGALGKTKEWSHDEIVKQISELETHEPVSTAVTPTKEKASGLAPVAAVEAEKTQDPVSKQTEPEVSESKPTSLALEETPEPQQTPMKHSTPAEALLSSPMKTDIASSASTPAKLENARAVVVKSAEMPRTIDIRPFNAAALPSFA